MKLSRLAFVSTGCSTLKLGLLVVIRATSILFNIIKNIGTIVLNLGHPLSFLHKRLTTQHDLLHCYIIDTAE